MDQIQELTIALANALREGEEHQSLLRARATVEEHEAARVMLQDLLNRQQAIQKDFKAGKDTASTIGEYRKLYEIAMYNPYVRDYLACEARLAARLAEINREIGRAIGISEENDSPDPQRD